MPFSDGVVFRQAVESVPAGIVVCDEAGTILFVNQQFGTLFGCESAELVGSSIDTLLPGLDLSRAATSGGPPARASRSQTGRRRNGSEVPVEVELTTVVRDSGHLMVASVVDISERLNLEHQIIDTEREHAAFERLVTELAARFVIVGSDQVDGAIIESLRQICQALDLDRSSWWQVSADGSGDALISHTWTHDEYRVLQSRESAATHVPWMLSQLRKGEIVSYRCPDDLPDADRDGVLRFGAKSGAAFPFFVNGQFRAILGFTAIRAHREWPPEVIDRLRLVAAVFGQALIRKENEDRLRGALAELQQLRDHLAIENVQLQREVKTLGGVQRTVVAESPATRWVLEQIESVAPTNATVLLLGETGAGKEVFAQAIHRASERRNRSMVTVNCAAIPATLLESELFGRERGAYTGALARQIGRFEMAQDSTIFLDEVGELPLDAQVKLLRVLQEKVIERLGGGQPVKVNVRIIAATNRDLEKAVAERTFREDLYYRLNVFPLRIPPLRERREDIPALVWSFIEEYATEFAKPIQSISKESLAALQQYSWPGNVRELRNMIEKAVIVAKGPRLVVEVPAPASGSTFKSTRLEDIEAEQIQKVLESVGWRVRGPGGAAERLGIKPNTLDSRMVKLGIRRPSGLTS